MAKKRKPAPPPPEQEVEARSCGPGEEKNNRAKVRALIIGALAAGGVFQMNNWQVQAHGNRSSHATLQPGLRSTFISPQDYFVLRQTVADPDSDATRELVKVTEQLHSMPATRSAQAQSLMQRKKELESHVMAPSTTKETASFLRQGDPAAAVAAIEGQGFPERVLSEYLWTLLDLAYLDGDSKNFTAEQRRDFIALAGPAAAYCDKMLDSLKGRSLNTQELAGKERAAEILHNIASFVVLMDDADANTLKLGQDAAVRALQAREELGQAPTIMRAHWMVAQYDVRAGRTAQAQEHLAVALRQATQLNDVPGIAWTKYSQAQALKKTEPKRAAALEAEVRRTVNSFRGKDTTIDFLRQELAGGKA